MSKKYPENSTDKTGNNNSYCRFDDIAIMLGLSTLPVNKEQELVEEMAGAYSDYKGRVRDNLTDLEGDNKDDFDKYLYRPRFYELLSKFDLAVLSLIDDFEFGTQVFGPYHPHWPIYSKDSEIRDFHHQVILGPTPKFTLSSIDLAERTFLAEPVIPLLGICQLKVNSSLLIGAGTGFLRCVINLIRKEFWKFTQKDKQNNTRKYGDDRLEIIILESSSWHELTVLLFSTNYQPMLEFILKIRELNFSDAKEALQDDVNLSNDWIRYDSGPSLVKWYASKKSQDISGNHIFTTSLTTLGFTFDLMNQKGEANPTSVLPINDKDPLHAFSRFSVKTGHVHAAATALDIEDAFMCVGRGGDVLYFPSIEIFQGKRAPEGISSFGLIEEIKKFQNTTDLSLHVTALNTVVIPRLQPPAKKVTKENHFWVEEVFNNFIISVSEIGELNDALKIGGASKVVTKRLLNSIAKYNKGIKDRLLFSNFIELKPFVDWLIHAIKIAVKEEITLEDLSNRINDHVDALDQAWRNRFHGEWKLSEITDFNLEYKGGIQQIITAFDGAYKAIAEQIGIEDSTIALVTGSPHINSTEKTIQLNYFDIFQPEFFAARASHEAAEHFLKKMSRVHREIDVDRQSHNQDELKILELADTSPEFEEETYSNVIYRKIAFKPNLKKALGRELNEFDQSFLAALTNEFFREVYADYNVYYFTFFLNSRLFVSWYRNMLYSSTLFWTTVKGHQYLNRHELIPFLSRILFVANGSEAKALIDEVKQYLAERDQNKDFLNFLDTLPILCEMVCKESWGFKDWHESVNAWLNSMFVDIYQFNPVPWCEDSSWDAPERWNQSKTSESAKDEIVRMRNQLRNGTVYPYDENEEGKDTRKFRFVQRLLFAYLSILDELSDSGKGRNYRLKRDKHGKPDIKRDRDAMLLFDVRGGTFTHDSRTRRDYLKYRFALVMSLWDMHQKTKYESITKSEELKDFD